MEYNGEPVEFSCGMESRAAVLLQYLLYNHNKKVSTDTIYNDVFSLLDSADPAHLVRMNIYRLKKMLKETSLPDKDYIHREGRLYFWTDEIHCATDVEKFMEAANAALQEGAELPVRIEAGRRAVSLYPGELLPNRMDVRWVAVERVKLKGIYIRCVDFLASQLRSEEGLGEVLEFCNRALQIYPCEEDLHILKMRCLFELRRFSEAVDAFDAANNAIYSQLGVPPSKKLLSIFSDLSRSTMAPKADIWEIKESLKEEDGVTGTYHMSFATFVEAYRIITRTVERTGQSVFLMLLELDIDESRYDDRSRAAVEALHQAILKSLRKGDIFTRYSYTQFLLLLLGITEENCERVFERIKSKWRKEWNGRGIQLSYRAVSTVDIDDGESGGGTWD
ncbi:MAG: BTAD domain-containing putative transcriptional regulator [Oscillospiraceae bacterium]